MTELILQKINAQFPDAITATEQAYDFTNIYIQKNLLKNVLRLLKTDAELNFHFLTTMCASHFPENDTEKEFGIMYQLHNMPKNCRIRIKSFMPKSDLNLETVTDLWKTAGWMERQEFDFFGVNFIGHPNLTRILNMDEMNYFPLRKEYPLEDLQRDDKEDKMFGR